MKLEKLNILIIDDDSFYREIFYSILKNRANVFIADNHVLGFDILNKESIDIILCDFLMPGMNGIDILRYVKKEYPLIDFIMISGSSNMDVVIDALREGALDFFKKPVSSNDIWISIERSKKFKDLKNENIALKNIVNIKNDLNIIGNSSIITEINKQIQMVADTPDTSVLIIGESGTGKELVARGIHNLSNRKNKLFGAVNMSAVPDSLFESEFFGYKKGSFTGAITDRAGWFEVSNNGSLFLDEIGDMPIPLQIKMLRVLEDRKFVKVGSQKEENFDIRIISATNKKIEELTTTKNFRLDLFHRLGTFIINMPPLRDRKEDIYDLSNYFLFTLNKKLGKNILKINDDVYEIFRNYSFPGNIRELRNRIENSIIICQGNELLPSDFKSINMSKMNQIVLEEEIYNLEEIEKRTIIKALQKVNYNKSEASKILNIEWNALHRRMVKYNISLQ